VTDCLAFFVHVKMLSAAQTRHYRPAGAEVRVTGRGLLTGVIVNRLQCPLSALLCSALLSVITYTVEQACQTEGPPRAIWVTFVLS
jgi:hypothetical protein